MAGSRRVLGFASRWDGPAKPPQGGPGGRRSVSGGPLQPRRRFPAAKAATRPQQFFRRHYDVGEAGVISRRSGASYSRAAASLLLISGECREGRHGPL